MTTDLTDHIVAVTGAAGRLGGFVVPRLLQSGATVAALVLDEEEAGRVDLPERQGRTFIGDVTDEAAVRRLFEEVGVHYGRLDALVHTVGAWGGAPFLETSLEEWRGLLDVNLTSAFLCFREAARLMAGGAATRPGRLIALASGQGADGAVAEQGAYSAAKAGVVRLVEAVAAEYEPSVLTAHAVAPSMILFGEEEEAGGVHARQIAGLCAYLCTGAGAALNGAVLRAYGTLR